MGKFEFNESQKLMVFFGAMDVFKEIEKSSEEVESEEELTVVAPEEIRKRLEKVGLKKLKKLRKGLEEAGSEEVKLKLIAGEEMRKRFEEARRRIIDVLNKSGDVTDITDLYKKPLPIMGFNPIVFNLRIPLSLQKVTYRSLQEQADVENFTIVYDGRIVMVAVICSLDKRPTGVYDAKDRFEELLETVYEFETIPPCLTHEAVVFVKREIKKSEDLSDVYLLIAPNADVLSIIQELYLRLNRELWIFYNACEIRSEIDDAISSIWDLKGKILENTKDFMLTKWHQVLKKRNNIRKIRLGCIEILRKLSVLSTMTQELRKTRVDIEEVMAQNNLFQKLIQKINLDEYTEPETIDIESLVRVIEHVRGEITTYSVNLSSIISALIGAVIGSILTIVASYLLGIFP